MQAHQPRRHSPTGATPVKQGFEAPQGFRPARLIKIHCATSAPTATAITPSPIGSAFTVSSVRTPVTSAMPKAAVTMHSTSHKIFATIGTGRSGLDIRSFVPYPQKDSFAGPNAEYIRRSLDFAGPLSRAEEFSGSVLVGDPWAKV